MDLGDGNPDGQYRYNRDKGVAQLRALPADKCRELTREQAMTHDLDKLADDLETLRTCEPGGAWFEEICIIASRIRREVRHASSSTGAFDDIIDLAPRLDPTVRQLDKRGERIAHLASLLHALSSGSLRSAEATRVTMYQLTIEIRSLAHRRRRVVVDSVAVDIGGSG